MTNIIFIVILAGLFLLMLYFILYLANAIINDKKTSHKNMSILVDNLYIIQKNQEKIIMLYKLRLKYVSELNEKMLYDWEGETPPEDEDPEEQPGSSGG